MPMDNNMLKDENFTPVNFELETTSIWSFPQRGNWATHNGSYRGNWSPYVPRNIILRYSNRGDLVLDQFVGSGTTMIETFLLGRKGIGVDINKNSLKIAKRNILNSRYGKGNIPRLHLGDARRLNFIKDGSIDLICTHPPYGDIIKYSNNINGDLSRYKQEEFLLEMKKVAKESYRVLKHGKYCAVMMGDIRKRGNIFPLGFHVMQLFKEVGFTIKEIIIKEQHNCRSTKYWEQKSRKYNFLLIAHEYIFVFFKE